MQSNLVPVIKIIAVISGPSLYNIILNWLGCYQSSDCGENEFCNKRYNYEGGSCAACPNLSNLEQECEEIKFGDWGLTECIATCDLSDDEFDAHPATGEYFE